MRLVRLPCLNVSFRRLNHWAVFILLSFLLFNFSKVIIFSFLALSSFPAWSATALFYKSLATFLLLAIIYISLFKFKKPYLFIGFYAIQMIYLVVNLAYYLYFHFHLNIVQAFPLLSTGITTAGKLAMPLRPELLLMLIDLPLFLLALIFYSKLSRICKEIARLRKLFAVVWISLVVGLWLWLHFYTGGWSLFYGSRTYCWGQTPIVLRYGTVMNNLITILNYKTQADLIKDINYGRTIIYEADEAGPYNLIIIQVEALGANVVDYRYKKEYITPFLHSLTDNSFYFPYTLSYHLGGATSDSEFTVFNSTEPFFGFAVTKLLNYDYPNSFVKKLSDCGYSALAFHGNRADFFNRDVTFKQLGFQEFYDIYKMDLKEQGWGASDKAVFDFVKGMVEQQKEPFYYHIITMTSHTPFRNVGYYYNNELYDDVADPLVRGFFSSMSYVDEVLEEFVEYVYINFPNTYVLIYGDHSPKVDNELYREASMEMDNKYFEFVPLFIITPEHSGYREEERAVSFLDIGPTLLFASGAPIEFKTKGDNLLQPNNLDQKTIPFLGSDYSRKILFNGIEETKPH